MEMWMDVEVTETHARNGRRADPKFCALALATKDAIGRGVENGVHVTSSTIQIDSGPALNLPPAVTASIRSFDASGKFPPVRFSLKLPEALWPRM